VLVIELAHHSDTLMVPLLLAVTKATIVARRLGAPSIYSARLGRQHPVPRQDDDDGGTAEPLNEQPAVPSREPDPAPAISDYSPAVRR
jgi:hypothetical protein